MRKKKTKNCSSEGIVDVIFGELVPIKLVDRAMIDDNFYLTLCKKKLTIEPTTSERHVDMSFRWTKSFLDYEKKNDADFKMNGQSRAVVSSQYRDLKYQTRVFVEPKKECLIWIQKIQNSECYSISAHVGNRADDGGCGVSFHGYQCHYCHGELFTQSRNSLQRRAFLNWNHLPRKTCKSRWLFLWTFRLSTIYVSGPF